MLSIIFLYAFYLCCSLLLCCLSINTFTTIPNNLIRDVHNETLVSSGNKFQLGFFAPQKSVNIRYLGIWYYSSYAQTIVWVANRDNPLDDDSGVFAIVDGNLQVIDRNMKSYWSTNLDKSSSTNMKMQLMDSGNLVLVDGDQYLWQSFDNPTDTFLAGMKMSQDIMLTSWKSNDDPKPGNFTFQLDQDELNQFIISKKSIRYWKSGVSGKFTGFDQMPPVIFYLLTNFTSNVMANSSVPKYSPSYYNVTRLVMSFSGQIQFYRWQDEKTWILVWAAPRDRCAMYNTCGSFGSCNNKNNVLCKCLPGFKANSLENWSIGDFSGGCIRNAEICSDRAKSDVFLKLSMMKVENPDAQFNAKSGDECRLECLNNCQCVGYSFEETEIVERSSSGACSIWSDDLRNLQEEYDGGRTINVRVAVSGRDLTKRTCEACGSNTIPYPLSTSPSCGDQMYSSFNCNATTGQVSFQSPSGTYRVTIINQDTRTFVIQTGNCGEAKSRDQVLKLNQSFPFYVTSWCNASPTNFSVIGEDEIEIGWKVPTEPLCLTTNDCVDLPNSLCNATREGKKKCLCDIGYRWDGLSLNCSRVTQMYRSPRGKLPLSIMIVVSFTCLIGLILSSTILYVHLHRRKLANGQGDVRNPALQLYGSQRVAKELIDSGKFKEDNTEGIEIPFFDLESIQVATKHFSNINKLGQGGFGPVYKGIFPGGQEIAVKRLSRCSGQGQVEFKNEVVLIAKLQHRNLVRLLGYCVDGEEKMLLYEYMPNKSLDSFIFDRKLCLLLDWEKRYNIILGIARGLLYLHQDSRLRIIHRDLKTSNILLDEEMNPKISDFGLARIFGEGTESAVNTNRVVGTYGYMSPEYALDGLFSFKSDVFSFGVVVLEILSGKRNTGFYQPEKSLSLLGHAWHLWKEQKSLELMDSCLRGNCETKEFLKCVTIGLLCVQEDPSDRPTMSNVVFMLGSENASLQSPKQPAFVVRRCQSSSSSRNETFSKNELTITLEDGR